jgi:hypothetical protein
MCSLVTHLRQLVKILGTCFNTLVTNRSQIDNTSPQGVATIALP